jgi:hypothetical protein
MSKIEVNQISSQCGSTLTIGQSGDTVTLASGATQTGFGRTGTVDWCTTAKTSPFTGVSGKGYFVNTTCGAVTVTLPASPSAGDIISVKDYAGTWNTNAITFDRNGSKIGGGCSFNPFLINQYGYISLIYVDATKGWLPTDFSTSSFSAAASYITASGGSIATCGDYKIHTFTSDGCFAVTAGAGPLAVVDYLVVAGGGGGEPTYESGGAGAGGFRESYNPCTSGTYTASPLATPTSLPVSITTYPITVGGGGSNSNGSNSVFSTITSSGGGRGGGPSTPGGSSGGSGGGVRRDTPSPTGAGAAGNTPPVSPPQGNAGGNTASTCWSGSGGGGGATSVGSNGGGGTPGSEFGGPGGTGAGTAIYASPTVGTPGPSAPLRYFSGGGGGSTAVSGNNGTGGYGGGANGVTGGPGGGSNGTTNTGGGSSGNGTGGSGIVMIRYKFQN